MRTMVRFSQTFVAGQRIVEGVGDAADGADELSPLLRPREPLKAPQRIIVPVMMATVGP